MAKKKTLLTADKIADLSIEVIEEGKGENIVKLPVAKLSVLADYFILCTANSDPHLRAISQRLKRTISKDLGIKPKQDGVSASSWIVMDYGNVVIHILSQEMRELYQLEGLWGENPEIETLEKISESRLI